MTCEALSALQHRNQAPTTMSGKALNKANLEKLGTERLAALIIDLVQYQRYRIDASVHPLLEAVHLRR